MSDKQLVSVINSLVNPDKRKELKALEPRGALPGKKAVAQYSRPSTTGTGGIASPVTEADASAREYWPERLVPSSDGLSWLRWKPLKKIVMQDANGEPVILEFKDVPAV